jgi:hypothetical protein
MRRINGHFISLSQLIWPLQGLSTPTTQMPICVTAVTLPLIPSPDVCAFIIIIDIDNESMPIPIAKNTITGKICESTCNVNHY